MPGVLPAYSGSARELVTTRYSSGGVESICVLTTTGSLACGG